MSEYCYEVAVSATADREDIEGVDIRILWPHESRSQMLYAIEGFARSYIEAMAIQDSQRYQGAVFTCSCVINDPDHPDSAI